LLVLRAKVLEAKVLLGKGIGINKKGMNFIVHPLEGFVSELQEAVTF
jgi:hypothetical protein